MRRATRERARAEAAEWAAMVDYRDGALSRLSADASAMRRMLERSAIALQVARETGLSEGQVVLRLAAADRLIEHGPKAWTAFTRGRIDAARAREISLTIDKLERDDSRQRLDDEVVAYAVDHTVAELRRWLKRFVARVEADLMIERAELERDKRHVRIEHTDDGMAWLQAYLPSHQAAAVEKRLERTAKALKAAPGAPEDRRTQAQRRADLLVHLLTAATTEELPATAALRCDIAVTIDAAVLTGAIDAPVQSADGAWQVPTDWLLDSAFAGEAFWHRMLLDPLTSDVLAHEYIGYSPPDILARAIRFRSGVCATPGCLRPADQCELDHQIPWPHGPTRGDNLKLRCKRHHAYKGHGIALHLLDARPRRAERRLAIELDFVAAA